MYSNSALLLLLRTISIFFFFISVWSGTNRPHSIFTIWSLLALYPLLPLFTGPIKGMEELVKQSNNAVMECTAVPVYSLNAHSFSWSKSLFLSTTLFFSFQI